MKIFKKLSSGFTLIELLVVIAVLGVLAAAVVAAINPASKINAAKDSTVKGDLNQIVSALQANYSGGTQTYPAALAGLTPDDLKTLPKQQSGNGGCVTASGADAVDYCYTEVAGQDVAVWGALYNGTRDTAPAFYCWDSTSGAFKTSATAVAGQTTCP